MASYYQSPAGQAKTGDILVALTYLATGFFVADTISSAPFDWSIIRGKRELRWMHLVYFSAKASIATFLIQNVAIHWIPHEINCQAYMYGLEFVMGMAVITSSALLSFRAIVVNNINGTKLPVKIILGIAGAGVVAAWMHGVADVTAVWLPAAATPYNDGQCYPTHIKDTYYVKYVVTIVFDFLVLALAVRGIALMNSKSRFGGILIRQGIIYFVLSLIANLSITILTVLKLSSLMSLLLAVLQSTICIIASTRLYSQLAMEGTNTTHVPSTRRTSFQDTDIMKKSKMSETMTMEEGLMIEVHTNVVEYTSR